MRLAIQCKITRISCALYFTLFHFRFFKVGCIFSRIPFAALTLLFHLHRRVVRTSACPSDPPKSTSLVSAFPLPSPSYLLPSLQGWFFTILPLSSWFSIISGSCTLLFRSDSYPLPCSTTLNTYHRISPRTPSYHSLHPHMATTVVAYTCRTMSSHPCPYVAHESHASSSHCSRSFQQSNFGMHVDHASWDGLSPYPGRRTRTWIFHSPNAFSYIFTVLVSRLFFLLVPKPC